MDKTIDGIVVSTETESGALKINTARARLGLQKLDVLVVPLVHDANGEKLSSERIISGKTDRAGEVYQSLLKHKSFKLPGMLRKKTAEPLGMIVQDEKELIKIVKRSTFVVAVGDEVTRTINRGAKIDLAIVDFLINRQKQIDEITELGFGEDVEVLVVKNDAGTISRHLSDAVIAYFSKPKSGLVIKVDGEEDLAVVPVILCAPLNTLVVYGQRGKGAVVVKVGELVKERVRALLSQFKIF